MDGLSGNREYYRLDSNFGPWKSLLLQRHLSLSSDFVISFCKMKCHKNQRMLWAFLVVLLIRFCLQRNRAVFFFSLKLPVLFKICKFKYGEVREHNHQSEPGTETAGLRLTFKSMFCLFISAFPQNKHLLVFFPIIISAAERDGSQIYAGEKRFPKAFHIEDKFQKLKLSFVPCVPLQSCTCRQPEKTSFKQMYNF